MWSARAIHRRWRRFWFRHGPSYRHSCLKCGFLAFASNQFDDAPHGEASESVRRIIAAEGKAGWFAMETAASCYRHLWDWEDESPVAVITYEANRPRFACPGYYRYSPGRDPKAHLTLEDERRGFGYQKRLAWLAFVGGLIGALIGAAGKAWLE